jgi:hypothetical protein
LITSRLQLPLTEQGIVLKLFGQRYKDTIGITGPGCRDASRAPA